MSEHFDEQALMDHVDGDLEFLQETVDMLEEDGPELLDQIQAAVTARDAAALVKPAHTLKGIMGNFFAEKPERVARELERMGREEQLAHAETAVSTLRQETERLITALKAFLRNQLDS